MSMSMSMSMRIGIAGAGAIGCTLAALLAKAGDAQSLSAPAVVSVLARGETLRALETGGVMLHRRGRQLQGRVIASDDAAQLGAQDVLFVCAKSQDVVPILAAARQMIDEKTVVVPLVNGVPFWFFQGQGTEWQGRAVQAVDQDGAILRSLPASQIVGAVTFVTAERTAPAVVVSDNPLLIVLGEIDHSPVSERIESIAAVLSHAGIEARCVATLRDTLWTKMLANLTSNPLSVISGATLHAIYSDPHLLPVVREMLGEGLALAAAFGARIPFGPARFISEGAAMGMVRTSMLQDFLAGRPLELAAIGDAVLELARLHGMDMPVSARVIGLAHFRAAVPLS
mgnify:CR=1 FL=1